MVINKYKKKLKASVAINSSKMRISIKNKNALSMIYILLDQNNNRIKVFDRSKDSSLLISKDYQHIGNKLVSDRESKLISIIVEELYKIGFKNGYKENLIGCLNSLGFNTISSNSISKKTKLLN